MRLAVLMVVLYLALGCSDDRSGLTPAERARKSGGMSEEVWKVYSGTESGVSDDKPDASKGPKPAEAPKGTQ